MDPLADKLLVTAARSCRSSQMELAPAWMVAVILGREFFVTVLRSVAHARGQTLPASPLGKVKMVAQVVAILTLLLGRGHLQGFFFLGQIALWVATLTAFVSAVDYSPAPEQHPSAPRAAAAGPGGPAGGRTRASPQPCQRLSSAIRFLAFLGVLALRKLVDEPVVVRQRLRPAASLASRHSPR